MTSAFHRMLRLALFVFTCAIFVPLGMAGERVRLAICSDGTLVNEADLITAELSKASGVSLLERQQVMRMAEERALVAGKSEHDIQLGELLGADGLLILTKTEVDGRELVAGRLVAVHLGVVIDEWISPPYEADEGGGMVNFVARRVGPLMPKLRIQKADAIPVSVAGVFAAVDSPELRAMERELTWWLVHRLTKEPSVFVLERRNLEHLALEKQLTVGEATPFLSGAVIVEGKLEKQDAKLDLTLRIRRPGEKKAKPCEVSGDAGDLPAFAEKMAMAILKDLKVKTSDVNWNIEEEATVYADQAEWAMDHRMVDLCITSAESAWALGRRDVDVARMRVMGYSLIATPYWPDILGDTPLRGGFNVGFNDWSISDKNPKRDLATAIRSLEVSLECLSTDLKPSRIPKREFRPVAAQALLHASKLIKKHFISGKYHEHKEQVDELRALAIDVAKRLANTPEINTPYHNIKYRKDSLTLQSIAGYAPYWHDHNEEIIAWYHRLFRSVPRGETSDDALKDTYSLERFSIYDEDIPMRIMPWVAAWNPAENRKRQLDMLARLKKLTESSDFDDQLVGWASLCWLVKQAGHVKPKENDIRWPQDYAEAIAGKKTYTSPHEIVNQGARQFFWDYRDRIAASRRTVTTRIFYDVVIESDREYRMRYARYMLASGHLNHWFWLADLLENLPLSEEECIELYEACMVLRENVQQIEDADDQERATICLNETQKLLVKRHPALKPPSTTRAKRKQEQKERQALEAEQSSTGEAPATIPPFSVTRYWFPAASQLAPKLWSGYDFPTNDRGRITVTYANGRLWFVQSHHSEVSYLVSIAPDSLDVDYYEIPIMGIWGLNEAPVITKDAFYLLDMKGNMKLDLRRREWKPLALPRYPYSGRLLGDAIFLRYEFGSEMRGIDLKQRSSAGSGIVRVDPADDRFAFLASSRRRPAETILDACEPYIPEALYGGPGGEVFAAIQFQTSGERKLLRMRPGGDWEETIPMPDSKAARIFYQNVEGGLLALVLGDAGFQAVFFGADGGAPEVLLSTAKNNDHPKAIFPGDARWDFVPRSNHKHYWMTAFDYNDGRLYQMKLLDDVYDENFKKNAETPTPPMHLRVYVPNKKQAVTIPLQFQLSDADKSQIIAHQPNGYHLNDHTIRPGPIGDALAVKNVERVSGIKAVPEGLVFFGGGKVGFWLLPMAELDELIERYASEGVPE